MVQKTFGIKPRGRSTGFESTKSKVHEENYMQCLGQLAPNHSDSKQIFAKTYSQCYFSIVFLIATIFYDVK